MTEGAHRLVESLAQPLTDPSSRTFLPALLIGAGVALWWAWRQGPDPEGRPLLGRALGWHLWTRPTAVVDLQLLIARRLLALLGVVPAVGGAWVVAVWWARTLDGALGVPAAPELPLWALTLGYTVVLFVAWDFSRYVVHRAMHELPALWEIHQVHHSAEVLTPLTFHRIHPLESVIYGVRGLLVTGTVAGLAFWLWRGEAVQWTLLGVHGIGLVLNLGMGNLRHSHIWLGFGRLERWWISPAQHQLHHSADPADFNCNYGTWLALWDRLGGTWRRSGAQAPARFGVEGPLNHRPDGLISALVGPVVALSRRILRLPLRLGARLLALVGLTGAATAAELPEPASEDHAVAAAPASPDHDASATAVPGSAPLPGEDQRPTPPVSEEALRGGDFEPYEIIVYGRQGSPRVAGSAHAVDEEELERFEYDDIGRVLAKVPGVYVRGEDGFGLRPNIGMRGGNSDRSAKITLLEDGVPLGPSPYAAPAAYYFPMPTRLVGVEVYKGPAATRFGPQTIGGAVNLLTRAVPSEGAVGQVDLSLGMRSTAKVHGYAGAGDERLGFLIEGAHLSTDGFKALDGGGPTGFERQDLLLKGRIASDPGPVRHIVELKLGYGRERSNETYLGLSGEDFASTPYRRYAASALDQMQWQRTQADLSWRVRSDTLDIRTVAYHRYLARDWTKLNRFSGGPSLHDLLLRPDGGQAAVYAGILRGEEDSASTDQYLMIGTNDRTYHSFGLQSVLRHEVGGQDLSSSLEAGVRLHGDHVARLHTEDPYAMQGGTLHRAEGERLTNLDSLTGAQALSAHLHDDLKIGWFHLVPGFRVEAIRTTAELAGEEPAEAVRVAALPGLALLAEVGAATDLFVGVHRGFSPVGPGQPDSVRPEVAWTWEAGIRQPVSEGLLELVGFFSDYSNLSGSCTLSGGCDERQIDRQYNAGGVHVYGLEALARRTVPLPARLSFHGELTYTLTRSAFRSDFRSDFPQFGEVQRGDALPYVPVHQGALRAVVEHPRASLAVAANARSPMRDLAGQGAFSDLAPIPGVVLIDLAAEAVLTERLRLYGTVNNLMNTVVAESWRPFGARPNAPLQAMVGIKASL